MANMIMGILILKKKYGISKYISVILITIGIITCTMVSASKVVSCLVFNSLMKSDLIQGYVAFLWNIP